MAQLSDDCFAFGGPLMPVSDAVDRLVASLSEVEETETISLFQADGRVVAQDILAPRSLPPFTNSAVDGYAVNGEVLPIDGDITYSIVGRVQAGSDMMVAVKPYEAVRIFTGAPMPIGADTVFMQEDVGFDEAGQLILPPGLKRGANVRPAGEDIATGQVALRRSHRLRPQDVALVAALGLPQIEVRRRVRVAVFSNGNELVAPGSPCSPAQLFDSNRVMLMTMLSRLGCEVDDLGILADDPAMITSVLKEAAATHDLVLASGGVSTGEADYVKTAVESVGSLVFWRIAIKPGRPVAMGVIGGTPFIGLPGNPVASFVTFTHIARPAILALSGAQVANLVTVPVRAAFSYRKKADRREYVRVRLRRAEDGILEAVKFPREGAGLLSSLVETDGLVELPEEVIKIEPDQTVAFLPYAILF